MRQLCPAIPKHLAGLLKNIIVTRGKMLVYILPAGSVITLPFIYGDTRLSNNIK